MSIPISRITEEIPKRFSEDLTTVLILDQAGLVALEKPIKLENPYDFDPNRFACGEEVPTLERFLSLTTQIILDAQIRENILEKERVTLTDEYPAERFDRFGEEVISYRIISRKPGNMSTDAKSRPQRGFGYSYHLRSPKYPDKVIIVESRTIDHIIEFSCWSKRARLANERALWLERTLINQTWAYQSQGIDRFFWEERLADTYYNVGGQPLYQRPLRFFVRLNEFRPKAEPAISHISYEVRATDGPLASSRSLF